MLGKDITIMTHHIAPKLLLKNHLLHIDMLECIRRGSAEILFASEEGVLLLDIPSQIYMITAQNNKIAEHLISKLPDDIDLIVSHDIFTYKLLSNKFNFSDSMTCYNAVYTKKVPIESENTFFEIRHLTHEYKDIIMDNYSKAYTIDDEYMRNRLDAKVMLGAFIDNTLCGFVGSHIEGSIGMLEVFPEYRGKGIGRQLEITAINKALADNRYIYCQVIDDNSVSISLQKKLGFELSKNKVYWLIK